VTQANRNSRGSDLARRFYQGRTQAQRAARPGARQLPILNGVNPSCQFTRPMENVVAEAGDILIESQRVFRHGNSVMLEVEHDEGKSLTTLSTAFESEPAASSLLANLFICEQQLNDNSPPVQYPPPNRFTALLFTNEPLQSRIPKINMYALRPVFDEDYMFRGPGWYEDVGYLVHGPAVEPILTPRATNADALLDRLPPRTKELLNDFCFKSAVDLVNAVGVLLTGILMPQFVSKGKAVGLLDGNQPGIGKTLLARVAGIVLDGKDPKAIHFTTDDEELSKRTCATLRENGTSVLLFDNAKLQGGGEINSPFLEANSMAPEISLRILGTSTNFTRPNDLLWFLTMNLTKASSDLVSRCVPIRFYYEGDPKDRDFQGREPLDVAHRYREVILGELAGMVVCWNQCGRPLGRQQHRLSHWAAVIGGILDANGLPGFLTNLNEAAEEFNTGLDELTALAEAAIHMNSQMIQFLPNPSGQPAP